MSSDRVYSRGTPLSRDEQMQAAGELLKAGDLIFMAVESEEGEISIGINAMYEDPGNFGILMADLVTHIIGSYARAGYSHKAAREVILAALGEELDFPTYTPNVIYEARRDRPKS